MSDTCGCCEGIELLTPATTANRPGLSTLRYRVGTHGSFLQTMKARLSGSQYPILRRLTTRESSDPAIALLDAWATVADVLTFYQERIANEGYLRTATERRSVLDLARLIGYRPRPGVSATAYLAFTVEDGFDTDVPAGTRVQSLPGKDANGKDEKPQPFETSEPLKARWKWNALRPRLKQPQYFTKESINYDTPIYVDGTTTRLKVNSPLLVTYDTSDGPTRRLYRTLNVVEDQTAKHTQLMMQPWNEPVAPPASQPPIKVEDIVNGIIDRYTDVKEFGLAETNTVVVKVRPVLADDPNSLKTLIAQATDETAQLVLLEGKLKELEDVLTTVNVTRRRLHNWLSELIGKLDAVRKDLTDRLEAAKNPPPNQSLAGMSIRALKTGGSAGGILGSPDVFGSVSNLPIPNLQEILRYISWASLDPRQLSRDPGQIFAAKSDMIPRAIFALNPAFRAQQYYAKANAKVPQAKPAGAPPETVDNNLDTIIEALNKAVSDRTWINAVKNNLPQLGLSDAAVITIVVPDKKWTIADGDKRHRIEKVFLGQDNSSSPNNVFELAVYKNAVPLFRLNDNGSIIATTLNTMTTIADARRVLPQLILPDNAVFAKVTPDHAWTIVAGERTYWLEEISDKNNNPELDIYTQTMILSRIEALRVPAALFGHNNPGQSYSQDDTSTPPKHLSGFIPPTLKNTWGALWKETSDVKNVPGLQIVILDKEYSEIKSDTWITIVHPEVADTGVVSPGSYTTAVRQIDQVQTVSLSANGSSLSVSVLVLKSAWLTHTQFTKLPDDSANSTQLLRKTRVYAQPELLKLVEMPITDPIEGDMIELAELYDGLDSGRWLIVSGERADVFDDFGNAIGGLKDSEQVMVDQVVQDVQHIDDNTGLPGDSQHTFLKIAPALTHKYKPDTVTIYANVIKATHGETLSEVFGSGDGSLAFQQFALRQTPLTYVAAPTPAGATSTLIVRVNGVQWHETETLVGLGPKDRNYLIRIDDDGKTSFIFGNGRQGARLPTGVENIKGQYRRGLGKPGNVRARQISLLAQKPLHVKSVINPMAATGGADPESRDQARRTAPLAVAALDRLVSVRDYADFARTFAGIGKAEAVRLSDGRREVVHLTIAGIDDIPISKTSDLFRNLQRALHVDGEAHQPIVVDLRDLSLLVIYARVRLLPDYDWDLVEPQIRAALLDTFSFDRRELGQDVTRSEVLSMIQAVAGVAYVDLENLDSVDEQRLKDLLQNNGERTDPTQKETLIGQLNLSLLQRVAPDLARVDPATGNILPAQIAYLDPTLPDTLILKELKA